MEQSIVSHVQKVQNSRGLGMAEKPGKSAPSPDPPTPPASPTHIRCREIPVRGFFSQAMGANQTG